VAGAAVVLIGAAIAVIVLLGRGSGKESGAPRGGSTPGVPFTFPLSSVRGVALRGAAAQRVSRTVATGVQTTLSAFYRSAFLDPAAWSSGPADTAWRAFDGSVRQRAVADTDALTIGRHPGTVASIAASSSTLAVRVLVAPGGLPQAAIADVTFEAGGRLGDGGTFEVSNRAHFLLQPVHGAWVVTGYPSAHTNVSTGAGAGSPSPSVSSS
jgi:hypothetical protein